MGYRSTAGYFKCHKRWISFTNNGRDNPKINMIFQSKNQPFDATAQIAELAKGGTFWVTFDARTNRQLQQFHVFLGEVGWNLGTLPGIAWWMEM